MPQTDLSKPIAQEKYARADMATGLAEGKAAIDRSGGDRKAGLVRGAAVITRGEARGHGMWVDKTMLSQVLQAITEAGPKGIKARFTHPSLSSDGLGSFLGRFKHGVEDGDAVRADLHISPSAHSTPDGDLASYVLDLAEEDPEAFGTSIVFQRDTEAETEFETAHTKPGGRFESPDPDNTNHFRHARLKALRAIDAVDSPAANPQGLFHAQAIGPEADALLAYSLGLTSERPALTHFSVDPDRVSGFVARFLDRNQLSIVRKEPSVSADDKTFPADNKAFSASDLKLFAESFGEDGAKYLLDGKSFEEAQGLHRLKQHAAEVAAKDEALSAKGTELQAKITELQGATKERDELKAKLDSLSLGGEQQGVSFSAEEGGKTADPKLANKVGGRLAAYAAGLKLRGEAKSEAK